MRIVELTGPFRRTRLHLAPIGSREDVALRAAIRRLAGERFPIPAPNDREAFRTPLGVCWMRPIPGTLLCVEYTFEPPRVRVLAVLEDPSPQK